MVEQPQHDVTGSPKRPIQTDVKGKPLRRTGGAFGGPNSTGSAAATAHKVPHWACGGPHSTGTGIHEQEPPVDPHPEHAGHEKGVTDVEKEKMPITGDMDTRHGHEKAVTDEAEEKVDKPESHVTEGGVKDTVNEQGEEKDQVMENKEEKMPHPTVEAGKVNEKPPGSCN